MDTISFHGLTGHIVKPDDPAYEELRQGWNKAITKYPIAIVYCRTKADVRNAILWSRRNLVPLRVRSGGHNYEGYSTDDAALVIDISEMNELTLEADENQLTIEGGVKLCQLYEFVSSRGYPFPGGTCPTVGVSGFALGGGWGLSCRHLGLGCDSLIRLELVDYEGMIIMADYENHADLFWASQGAGGGNFGVVVSMTFRLPLRTDNVTFIEFHYPHAGQEKQALFLNIWQKWLSDASEKITLIMSVYNAPSDGIAIIGNGIFYGTPEEAYEILKPFTDLGGARFNLEYLTFLEAVTKIGASHPDSEKFQSTGRFVHRDYSPHECAEIVGLIRKRPKGSVLTCLTVYALGGRVAEKSQHDTAFFYRGARYILGLQSIWEDKKYARANRNWIKQKFRYLESVTEGSFVNFPYGSLIDYLTEYYGMNADRLRAVKKVYDPLNVFSFPQSID